MTDSYLLTISVWLKTLFGTYFVALHGTKSFQ